MTRTARTLTRIPGASQLATLFRSSLLLVLLLAPLGSAAAGPAAAQEPTKDEVEALAVVYRLFDGMRARDRATLESVFHEKARLMSAWIACFSPGCSASQSCNTRSSSAGNSASALAR